MTVLDRLSRPLQRKCTFCRRSQEVPLSALYYVIVPNKGGGTRRDGGFDCRYCAKENLVAPAEMPKGILITLPGKAERVAAAPAPVVAPIAPPPPVAKAKPAAPPPKARPLPPPVWSVGAAGRQILLAAFRRFEQDGDGLFSAFVRDGGRLSIVAAPPAAERGNILAWLDRTGCELLVLAGSNADGSRWKAVFHPLAGAATLANEPAEI